MRLRTGLGGDRSGGRRARALLLAGAIGCTSPFAMGSELRVPTLGAGMQDGAAPEGDPSNEGSTQGGDSAGGRPAVLDRQPQDLPRAVEGRWEGWEPERGVTDELVPLLTRAGRAYGARDYPVALEALYSVLESQPDQPVALYQMGIVYFRLRRYADAQCALERFLEMAPSQVAETRALAHCYYSLGNYPAAIEHYRKVLAEHPDEVEALRGLGLALYREGELEPGLELLTRVVELDPEHGDAWTWIAQVNFELGELDAAKAAIDRAVEDLPYEPRPRFVHSRILYDLGEDDAGDLEQQRFRELSLYIQAVRQQEGYLLYDPSQLGPLSRLVELHETVGNLVGVRENLAQMVRFHGDNVELRLCTLDVLVRMDDPEGAAVAAESMEIALPESPDIWKRLQTYYGGIGNRTKQIQAGERYLRLKDAAEEGGGR